MAQSQKPQAPKPAPAPQPQQQQGASETPPQQGGQSTTFRDWAAI